MTNPDVEFGAYNVAGHVTAGNSMVKVPRPASLEIQLRPLP